MTKQGAIKIVSQEYQQSQSRTASYIADLLLELEQIAERERIEPLDRLLKIAREEAARISMAA